MNLEGLTREYSQRLGLLTASQLQAALDRFDLGRLVDATPITRGVSGQNLFLSSTTGEYVLRGKPHYDWQFPAERFFAQLIHDNTDVPVPWPYLIDPTRDVFGWPYIMMPCMPGDSLPDFATADTLPQADGLEIACAMGDTLARLHAVTWQHCGEYDLASRTIRPIETTYRAWISGRLEDRVARCVSDGSLQDVDAVWCRRLLQEHADALDVPFTPTLVHHDYKRGNLMVQHDGRTWQVSGVFDLMECHIADPEEDLVRAILDFGPAQAERCRAFVRAYADARPLRARHRERYVLNMLRDALLIWGFEQRFGRTPAPGRAFREWAEPYVLLNVFDG